MRHLIVGVVLRRRNPAGLRTRLAAASDRTSPGYGRYLTPDHASRGFDPPASSIRAVSDYLRSRGLAITAAPRGWPVLTAAGSVRAVEAAFGLHLYRWRDRAGGRTFFANDGPVRLPSMLAPLVQAVAGLDDYARFRPATASGTAAAPYAPWQLRRAYDVEALHDSEACAGSCDGTGEAVAVFADGRIDQENIKAFDQDLPALLTVSMTQDGQWTTDDGNSPSRDGDQGEAELDVEVIHAIAPGAAIHLYELPKVSLGSGNTVFALRLFQFAQAVFSSSEHIASISFGDCEDAFTDANRKSLREAFLALANVGKSVFVSSGDAGKNCGDNSHKGVNYPASDPSVTGVGGTSLSLNDDSSYRNETAWDDETRGRPWATSGGWSIDGARPDWQQGGDVYASYFSTSAYPHRLVPDVGADGDGATGLAIDAWGQSSASGTSASAPQWAGLAAIYNQYAQTRGSSLLGFANPLLYQTLAARTWAKEPFFDVTDNPTPRDALFGPAGLGWDPATGLGSFNAYNLVRDALPTLTATPTCTAARCKSLELTASPFPPGDTVDIVWSGKWLENYRRTAGVLWCKTKVGEPSAGPPRVIARDEASCIADIPSSAPSGGTLEIEALDEATRVTASASYPLPGARAGGRRPPRLPGRILLASGAAGPPAGPLVYAEMNAYGRGVRALRIGSDYSQPTLSPDGTRLALIAGQKAIAVASADGTGVEKVWPRGSGTSPPTISYPAWSPSGEEIAFVRTGASPGQLTEIDVVNADGSAFRRVLAGPEVSGGGLVWSPDGSQLGFVSSADGIDVVPAAGGAARTIVANTGSGELTGLAWAPGPLLLFPLVTPSGAKLASIAGDGTGLRTVLPAGYLSPSWAPDGVHFLAIGRERRVVVATADGVQATIGPANVVSAQWGGPP